ncbi:unnamed protein product [Coccothraustes coccothraustes]
MRPPAPASAPSRSSPQPLSSLSSPLELPPSPHGPGYRLAPSEDSGPQPASQLVPQAPLICPQPRGELPSHPFPCPRPSRCPCNMWVPASVSWQSSRSPSLPPPRTLADVGSWRTGLLPRGEEKRKMCFGSSPKPLQAVHGASPCDLTRNAARWPPDPRKSPHRRPCGGRPAWGPGAAAAGMPGTAAVSLLSQRVRNPLWCRGTGPGYLHRLSIQGS